jgi:hypothetical protein
MVPVPLAPATASTRAGDLPPPGRASARPRILALAALPMLAGATGACDIPTEAPQWEQRWIVPADRTTVGVEELLPDKVWVTPDRSAFTVRVDPVSFHESLGSLCPACAPWDGLFVPKPAFRGDFHESVDLPEDVEEVQARSGRVEVVARNAFGFDPLRPPGGSPGTVTVSLRDGGPDGPLLDRLVVDGATTSFGPGSLLTRVLEYSGPVGATLTVSVDVDSPAGGLDPADRVLVSLVDEIQVTATPQLLEVTSAVIRVAGRSFDLIDTDLEVEELDQELVDRVRSGAFLMEISNPWSVAAAIDLTISGPTMGPPITKNVMVPAASYSSVRVDFTQAELRSFLGEPGVTLSGEGTVATGIGPVTLAPKQVLVVQTRLDLVLLVG